MADFLTCNSTGSGGGGTDCLESFAPTFNITLPDVGTPTIGELTIPDFSGITIEGIFKALEFLGLDPCAFIGPILNAISGVTQGTADAISNVFQEIADMPQEIIDGIQTQVQGDLDSLFPPDLLAAFSDPCETVAGAGNSAMEKAVEVEDAVNALPDYGSDITAIEQRLNALENPSP